MSQLHHPSRFRSVTPHLPELPSQWILTERVPRPSVRIVGAFVTPKSDSVLASVTNKVLQQLAKDMGLKVEQRDVSRAVPRT